MEKGESKDKKGKKKETAYFWKIVVYLLSFIKAYVDVDVL